MRKTNRNRNRWLVSLALALLLALVCAVAVADVEINATNFPDEAFRNYVRSEKDNGDGILTDAEISAVVQIDCRDENISSLKGIEFFTGLKYLYCDNNRLTALDVSKNHVLETLLCTNNQLTTLNVSGNPVLDTLSCCYNKLSTLDLRQCPVLKRIVREEQVNPRDDFVEWIVDGGRNYLTVDKNVRIITADITVSQVTLSRTNVTLTRTGKQKNPTLLLKAAIQPEEATNKAVEWKSSDPQVVTVDQKGNVKALKKGMAAITCTAKDGSNQSAFCIVTVKDAKVTKITLNKTKAKLKVGKTLQLKVKKFTPASPLNTKVKWTTSDKKIATVDKNGKVKAKKAGKVTITCTAQDGSKKTAKCTITVK